MKMGVGVKKQVLEKMKIIQRSWNGHQLDIVTEWFIGPWHCIMLSSY